MDVFLATCGLITAGVFTAVLFTTLAALVIAVGYQAGTGTAHAWHGRRLVRDAETYLRYPNLRDDMDHHDQPRKENPQP